MPEGDGEPEPEPKPSGSEEFHIVIFNDDVIERFPVIIGR